MNTLIAGGSGGIGSAFIDHLLNRNSDGVIHATYYRSKPSRRDKRIIWHQTDPTRPDDIEKLCRKLDEIDLCINAIGMLHDAEHGPEKSTRKIGSEYFLKSMSINALPTLLLARHIEPNLRHARNAHFATVSARVGSIGENHLGGWYSYRSSKAALNMILKTLSIEWKRTLPRVTVSALHPGTTDTALSRPFQKNVARTSLFSPAKSTACMLQVLDRLTPADSGRFWSFDGEELPW